MTETKKMYFAIYLEESERKFNSPVLAVLAECFSFERQLQRLFQLILTRENPSAGRPVKSRFL